jgi:Alpha/beta hydrolase domain
MMKWVKNAFGLAPRFATAAVLACIAGPAHARITNVVVTKVVSPAFGGVSFGSVGQYEQLFGTAFGEVDPGDPLNQVITDIGFAPRNAHGMVEYSMDIEIWKPIDLSRGNHTIHYDVVNRGNKSSPGNFNIGGSATAPGDGFLESEGYTLVWSGWEYDVVGSGIKVSLPVARNADGSAITGRVRSEYIFNSNPAPNTTPVTAPPGYEAVSTNNSGATLTRRVHQTDARELIPNSQWAFANCSTVPFPGVPSTFNVCLNGGFDTNHIYELLYTAKNPSVTGLGFAATRDFVTWLRGDQHRTFGQGNRRHGMQEPSTGPASPLGNSVNQAIIYGSSQSGRWIRTFIELGMNEDERGRVVFEGAIPHKSSNRGAFNIRFAQSTRLSGTQHTEQQYPGQESPQTWNPQHDEFSGINSGQLDRCRASHTCPKITHTNTDTEYWQALMSLNTTDSEGTRDVPIPPEVRIYEFSGTMHGGGDALNQPPAVLPPVPGNCQLRQNSNPFAWAQRALLTDLREWIVSGREPPPSMYSTLANHSLVKPADVHYPYMPAVNFTVPGITNFKFFLDRGPLFDVADISGVMAEPPVLGEAYTVLVPKVDADGNDVDGLRNVNVQVPLGTYLGWNVRKAGFSEGDSCDLTGGFIPFFRTLADRTAAGDPRPSLQERYPTHAAYVAKVTAAAADQVAKRVLLPADAANIIAAANAAAVP